MMDEAASRSASVIEATSGSSLFKESHPEVTTKRRRIKRVDKFFNVFIGLMCSVLCKNIYLWSVCYHIAHPIHYVIEGTPNALMKKLLIYDCHCCTDSFQSQGHMVFNGFYADSQCFSCFSVREFL